MTDLSLSENLTVVLLTNILAIHYFKSISYYYSYFMNFQRVIVTLHPLCLGAFSIWSQTIFFGNMHPKV